MRVVISSPPGWYAALWNLCFWGFIWYKIFWNSFVWGLAGIYKQLTHKELPMKRLIAALIVLLILGAVTAWGQQQPEKTYVVKESQLTPGQKASLEAQEHTQQITSYAGWGKEVGTAMKEGLSALNEEVNKFSESSAGKFTMFVIAYKVMGKDAVRFTIALPLWILGTFYFMYLFRKNFVVRRITIKSTGWLFSKERAREYKIVNEGARSDLAAWGYFAAFGIWSGVMALTAFA